MDPFSLATGGGGLSGGSSEASGTARADSKFGDNGAWNINFGSGSASGAPTFNPWLIGGLLVVGLIAFKMLKK